MIEPYPEEVRAIFTAYIDLRRDCMAVEELIGRPAEAGKEALSADDLKRLDKAIMVMKVGFKMMKKVLRSQGVGGMSAWREPQVTEPEAVGAAMGRLNDG